VPKIGDISRWGYPNYYGAEMQHLLLHYVTATVTTVITTQNQKARDYMLGMIWERKQGRLNGTKIWGRQAPVVIWVGRPSDNQPTAKHRVSSPGGFPVHLLNISTLVLYTLLALSHNWQESKPYV
jgi:hypothetical protein